MIVIAQDWLWLVSKTGNVTYQWKKKLFSQNAISQKYACGQIPFYVVSKAEGKSENQYRFTILNDSDGKAWCSDHVLKLDYVVHSFCYEHHDIYNDIVIDAMSSVSISIGVDMCSIIPFGYQHYKVALQCTSLNHIELYVMFKESVE